VSSRIILGAVLVLVMLVAGPSTYLYLASKTSKAVAAPSKPTAATPRPQAFSLPGTMYISQDGALYSLAAGRFHQLTPEDGWMQPSILPDGNILAVKRARFYSDIYVLSPFGAVMRKITNNAAPTRNSGIASNHWAFYPRLSVDGKTLWLAYDQPKFGYDVVLSIWAMPYGGTIKQGKLWTNAADYTGGDVQPIPLQGGIIYTRYDYGPDLKLVGRLWYTNSRLGLGRPLTAPSEDCRNPSMSPDGTKVVMICTYEKQASYLTIASWDGATLGPRQTILNSQLVAQPVWAPDGSGIAYLAPGVGAGPFQLWFLPRAAYAPLPTPVPTPTPGGPHNGPLPSPSPEPAVAVKPIQVTTNNGFDATSPIAWRS
jgi:hypothetical protein